MHKLLKSGFNVDSAQHELENHPECWRELTFRQDFEGSAHTDTETIYLRGPTEISPNAMIHSTKAINYPIIQRLPHCVELATYIMQYMQPKEVGRIVIVNLKPHKSVSAHIDEGEYADYYKRYHVPIKTNSLVHHYSQNDYVIMQKGELWEYAHKLPHHTVNLSDSDRWNMIFDFRF